MPPREHDGPAKKGDSGEVQAIMLQQLNRIIEKQDEQAGAIQACLTQQAALKASVELSLNDGRHTMDRHLEKITALERWRETVERGRRDDESTWGRKASFKPHAYEEPKSDTVTKKPSKVILDAATLSKIVKFGLWAGAVVAGLIMGIVSK